MFSRSGLLFIICLFLASGSIRNENIPFDRYVRYSEILEYLEKLETRYQDLVCVKNYGLSYENRNLTLITISSGGSDGKPLIFVDAGVHGREWLGPAQALYIIDQLVQNPKNRALVERVDWVIVPLANPDGYEYTHTTDRSWRKNRSKGKICDGVDLNRNFDVEWTSSDDECGIFYPGTKPFSEPETQALSQVISHYANRTRLYLSIHTAAQGFLYPFGHSNSTPENEAELRQLGIEAAEAVYNVNKTVYRVGSSAGIVNTGSGVSRDWVYSVLGIKLAYTVELEAYVNTTYEGRFEMPPERILGVVSEVFEAIKVFHDYVQRKFS
ncbi:hypothetical protein PPYR_13904 [Photinus pyralis]|uniref:Peptidase M14 domain-containing protein n=1 Tax=Photinus pyralis TaxID=7054 RepID=A0A1Y1MU98_PHOPY|nr:carboxypeptidase B-like [Photinus pyralis]KAB0794284.1 hypothetical protein PPYR_13904 [Photinus pyralis]